MWGMSGMYKISGLLKISEMSGQASSVIPFLEPQPQDDWNNDGNVRNNGHNSGRSQLAAP